MHITFNDLPPREALAQCLWLGLTAPTDAKAAQVTVIAEDLATLCEDEDVEIAKWQALRAFQNDDYSAISPVWRARLEEEQ